jgi:vancomycin resistance protein YoaR
VTYRSAFIKPLLAALLAIAGAGSVVTVFAFRSVPTIKPNSRVHGIDLGGLSAEDAARRLRIWWEEERRKPLSVEWPNGPTKNHDLGTHTPTELGVTLDDAATVAQLPIQSATDGLKTFFHAASSPAGEFPAKFKTVKVDLQPFKKLLDAESGPFHPAKVGWDETQIIRKPESTCYDLAADQMPAAVASAINGKDLESDSARVELPVLVRDKHVPDAELAKITDLVSSFTTHFPAYQTNRNNNIKVASGKLSSLVLMPGERLSFNGTVGERTVNAGFQEAGIYLNGKHDKGIGGGICQVSSTLYNAALFGNLKIVHHHNHSMPVAYVPIGRDATVNNGVIAVVSEFKRGTLTFRVFGVADPALSVQIERQGLEDWDQPTKFTEDPHLQPGQQVVVEKGSRGHKVFVFRKIFKNGELIKREPLGRSYYSASPRIIARGPAPLGGYPPAPPTPTHPR